MGVVFEVELRNPSEYYHAGQRIEGQLTLEMTDSLKMRGISVTFRGVGEVSWREQRGGGQGSHSVQFKQSETYLDHSLVLYGKAIGDTKGENPVHAPGKFTYPFKYQLPTSLPDSFECKVGHIRYFVKGTIDKPWKLNTTCQKTFKVISILDLNILKNMMVPQEADDEKYVCCCCCKNGPITAHIKTDKAGYVPGECILIDAEIDNSSTRKMKCSKARLIKSIVCYAQGSAHQEVTTLTEVEKGEIGPGRSEQWYHEKLTIPQHLASSSMPFCNIIDVTYFAMLVVDPKGPALALKIPVEVLIGSVPLKNAQSKSKETQQSLTENPFAVGGSGATKTSAPPPTYQEGSQKENVKATGYGNTYYSWEQPQGSSGMPRADL